MVSPMASSLAARAKKVTRRDFVSVASHYSGGMEGLGVPTGTVVQGLRRCMHNGNSRGR